MYIMAAIVVLKVACDCRFEDALEAVQRAARLDSNNRDVNAVMRRARAVTAARSNGNELFKTSRFSEACRAYGEGLEHDPYNSVLLCNRAACRSKLGQFEKAVEDCTAALNSRPSYGKARLRRADCNAKVPTILLFLLSFALLEKLVDNSFLSCSWEDGKLQYKTTRTCSKKLPTTRKSTKRLPMLGRN